MENPEKLVFLHKCQFTLFYFSRQCHRCHKYQYFELYIEIFFKKFCFSLDLVEMDTDPDPAK
jgi:hypothetical protein